MNQTQEASQTAPLWTAPLWTARPKRDDGIEFSYTVTDPADRDGRDGVRAVKVSIYHRKGTGIVLSVQPCRLSNDSGVELCTFMLFAKGRDRAWYGALLGVARRNDKRTETVARAVAGIVPALAAAWMADPDSAESDRLLHEVRETAGLQ